jgi:hypothetical protein
VDVGAAALGVCLHLFFAFSCGVLALDARASYSSTSMGGRGLGADVDVGAVAPGCFPPPCCVEVLGVLALFDWANWCLTCVCGVRSRHRHAVLGVVSVFN